MKRYLTAAVAATIALSAVAPVAGQRAQPRDRGSDTGGSQDGGARAVPRDRGDSAPAPAPAPRSGGGTSSTPTTNNGGDQRDGGSPPPYSRPRAGRNPTGEAVARPANNPPPSSGGGGTVFVPGYGGYGGYGGYYGPGYGGGYYPWGWGYGGMGLGGYYGFYDPWGYDNYYAQSYYSSGAFEGSLRLKITPRNASVFVDGYFAGRVDEFDGMFQRLRVESGPHRIEVREPGYESLVFEVRILPDRTVTYEGDLKRVP